MNGSADDGRVTLRKDTLKTLRRELGISQEKMAFLCAEKSLCVSVASLKRAETSKNVLYRTARDISRFYSVDLGEIIEKPSTGSDSNIEPSSTDKELSPRLKFQRNFILLTCQIESELNAGVSPDLSSTLAHIAAQYDAESVDFSDGNVHYTFGVERIKGNEVKRALSFSFRCVQLVKAMFGNQCQVTIALTSSHATTSINSFDQPESTTSIDQSCKDENQFIVSTAITDGVYIGHSLKEALPETVVCSPLATAGVDGKIWQITEEQADKSLDGNSKFSQPIVGRKVEITQFKAVLESATEYGSPQIVNLVGQAGIGKSRLSEEFQQTALIDNFELHTCSILDFYAEQSRQPLPSLLRSLLNIKSDASGLSLSQLIEKSGLGWLNEGKHLPLLYSLLAWSLPKPWQALLDTMSPERLYDAKCQLVVDIIQDKVEHQQQLIIFEDYHWADKQLRSFIRCITARLGEAPVVILITTRPGDAALDLTAQHESSSYDITQINLLPLSKKDSRNFADSFAETDEAYRKKCIEKAQGNPLFLEQLLKDQRINIELELPFSLQALITARVDEMSAQDQLAVRAAAIIGQRFSLPLLRVLINDSHYNPVLLVQGNIVSGTDDEYRFNHALIMDGIYQSITQEDRSKFHYLCSQWYSEDIVLQCRHLLKAKHEDALEKLALATEFLLQQYQFEEAKDLISIGFGMDKSAQNACRLHELSADANARLGDTQQALLAYESMLKNAENAADKVKALIGSANCLNTLDQFEEAQTALDTAHSISIEKSFTALLSRIYYLNGNFLFPKGRVQECFDLQKKALHFAKQANDKELEARALGGLGDAAYAQGKMYSAYNYFSRCLEISEKHDFKQVTAANLFMLGTVSIYHNESRRALTATEKSIATAELVGHKRAEIVSRLTMGWILLDSLRLADANEHIKTALTLAEEIGAKRFIPFLQESKARYFFLNGDKKAAMECISNAIISVEKLAAQAFIGPWLLSTKARFCEHWEEANKYLVAGAEILRQGSIGHNHYRFCVNAIETCLNHQQYSCAEKYIEQLSSFTQDEETPWASFYIKRARLIISSSQIDAAIEQDQLNALIQEAKDANLLTALASLENLLCDGLGL